MNGLDISQSLIRNLFKYKDGKFFNRTKRSNRILIGERSGCLASNGYRLIRINGKLHKEHRLIYKYWNGNHEGLDIDHINNIKDDNRIENLRLATRSQNKANCRLKKDNTSGMKGVCWDSGCNKWRAYIRVNYRMIYLGIFKSKDDAFLARKKAEIKYQGKYAFVENLNNATK